MQPKLPRVRLYHPSSHFPFPLSLSLNLIPSPTPLHPRWFVTLRFGTTSLKPIPLLHCHRTNPTKSPPIPDAHLFRLFSILFTCPPSAPSSKRNYVSSMSTRLHETLLRSTTLKNVRRYIVMDDASYIYLGVFLRPALLGIRLPRTLSCYSKRYVYLRSFTL